MCYLLCYIMFAGESQAEYIKCLVFAAKSIGVRTVVFNNRGLGGLALKVIDSPDTLLYNNKRASYHIYIKQK